MPIYNNKKFRRIVIPLLKFLNPGKISIKHHYTGTKFVLDAFRHKGYWYHGKKREHETMELFSKLIKPGDLIIEIGGHIGYITNYFSSLALQGSIFVFEPGINNLPFLKENIKRLKNVTLIQKAVSDQNGIAKFYIENLTGQNNSLLSDYSTAETNKKNAYVKSEKKEVEVETITLDTFCKEFSLRPDFIKIDIEGAELLALKGMHLILRECTPVIMVEITENWETIYDMLKDEGYSLYDENKIELQLSDKHSGNTFCINSKRHQPLTFL